MPSCKIYFFSGTGNTAAVAGYYKAALDEKGVQTELVPVESVQGKPDLTNLDYIGFGFPIYAFWMPAFYEEFLKNIPDAKLGQKAFVFVTYAGLGFYAVKGAAEILKKKGYEVLRSRGYVMPGNLTFSSANGRPLKEDELKKKLDAAHKNVLKVVEEILAGNRSIEAQAWLFGAFMSWFGAMGIKSGFWKKTARKFHATDECTSCGLCCSICPVGNIEMADNKPKFADNCEACVRCYNLCPQKAIIYITSPDRKERYKAPGYIPPRIR